MEIMSIFDSFISVMCDDFAIINLNLNFCSDVAKCKEEASWISSYKIRREYAGEEVPLAEEPDELAKNAPYLLSFYFSAATLTSAGFGDFSPQRYVEIICTIIFQLIGFFIIGYYTALLTSALACVVKPRLDKLRLKHSRSTTICPEFAMRSQFYKQVRVPAETCIRKKVYGILCDARIPPAPHY
jgi:hypothetical protein